MSPTSLTTALPYKRLAGFYFFIFCVFGIYMPFWGLYLSKLGYSAASIGLLASIGVISRIVTPGVWGYLADRTGRRMLLVRIACFAQVLAWVAICYHHQPLWALAAILLAYSFFQNGILAQYEAVALFWLKDTPEQYGRLRLWGSLGFAIAVVAGGWTFDIIGMHNLPWLVLGLAVIAFVNACFTPEAQRIKDTNRQASILQNIKKPAVLAFCIYIAITLLAHAPFYGFYSIYLSEQGYSDKVVGILWGLGVVAETIFFMFGHKLLAFSQAKYLFAAAAIIGCIRWALVGFFPGLLAVQCFAQLLHSVTFGVVQSLSMRYLANQFSPEQQGRAQALYSSIWGVSVGVGTLLIGYIWDTTGGNVIFITSSILSLLALGTLRYMQHS